VKTKVTIPLAIIILLMLAAAYRFLQILPYPVGGGRSVESPDKKYVADAFDLTDRYFFGGEKSYYEFTIKSSVGQQLRHIVFDAPDETKISWRDEGVIQWATNSLSVTFGFKGTQLTLSVKEWVAFR
jgi:hypothetical protein